MTDTDVFDMLADAVRARDASWRNRAACRGGNTDMFFPPANSTAAAFAAAKAICSTCPVTEECRKEWESMPSAMRRYGVWFGTTDRDRRGGKPR